MTQRTSHTRAAIAVAAVLLTLGSASETNAQNATATGTVTGLVFDSTAMQPLEGARVAIIGTRVTGVTDGGGRFSLAEVPVGRHSVSFYHDRLQELGVGPPSHRVELTAGERRELKLAVPSETTLLAGWCAAERPEATQSAIAGHVTDSLTGVPMPRAIVRAEAISRLPGVQPIEVRTDDAGYFRMCTLRTDVDWKLQAHFGPNSGRSVEVALEPASARLQDLSLLMSAEGTLSGYVRDHITGEPVNGAEIAVLGTASAALSDETGRFVLDDIPPGRHLITTDHLAFEERTDSVTIFSQETVDIEVRMATEALEVEGLVVTARTRFGRTSLAGGAKRADFISREDIELLLPRTASAVDLLRNMNAPGLRIREVLQENPSTGTRVPGLCIEVSRRSGGEGCTPAAVALNDVVLMQPDQVLLSLDPNVIDRIEVLSPVDAQFQFGSVAGNGAIAIYTR